MLDLDSTVKVLYGQQEKAVKGYNPTKPGRPSPGVHTYLMAGLRLVLGAEVQVATKRRLATRRRASGPTSIACRPSYGRSSCAAISAGAASG